MVLARIGSSLFVTFLYFLPVYLMYIFISRSLLKNPSKQNVLDLRTSTLAVMQLGFVAYTVGFTV